MQPLGKSDRLMSNSGNHKERLVEAQRAINYEVHEHMDQLHANALVFESIHEKLQRLEERVAFLEPHEED